MATPTTTDWEQVVGKTDPGFGCGTNFKKRRVNLKRSQTQTGQVAEELAAVQQEDTQLQNLISSKCGAKTQAVVALSSAGAEFYGLVRASAETMGLISMYKDLGTNMNGVGTGRSERSFRHCGPTGSVQIERSGHQ